MGRVNFMPHQREAIEKLMNGSILCADVGTGKSITALGYFYSRVCGGKIWKDGSLGQLGEPKNLYIITTARKRDTGEWEKECERFELSEEPITVTIDSWNNLHKYISVTDSFFIFDEQRVGGSGAWSKQFIRIARDQGNEWLLLSATPGDTWMDYIPVFVANGFYKNRYAFLRRHAVYNRYSKYPKVDKWLEPGYLEMLRRRITVTMAYDRQTVRHWETVKTDYDLRQYKKVSEDRWDIFRDEPIKDAAGACYAMRRVVNSYSERIKRVYEILRSHPRAIIFYNYNYELEILRGLSEMYDVAEWNGSRHDPIPESAQWVYLVQYGAGSEGWNCVYTDTIIFYSQNYSYKQMTQAAGRIDRLNTPYKDLYYYTITTDAPIDMAIQRALRMKRRFNEKNYISKTMGIEFNSKEERM